MDLWHEFGIKVPVAQTQKGQRAKGKFKIIESLRSLRNSPNISSKSFSQILQLPIIISQYITTDQSR